MQLNIYVPKGKERVVRALDEAAYRRGRSKNELVLEAIEAYLEDPTEQPEFQVYDLGVHEIPPRDDLYLERGS